MKFPGINKGENGFSYIDVMCALVILMVGILGLTAAITQSLVRSFESEQRLIAKQIAQSTIESIFASRDIKSANGLDSWDKVGNIGSAQVPRGIFVTGWSPVRQNPGLDGLLGTIDDACSGTGACYANGVTPTPGYERQVTIEDVPDPERPSPPNPINRRRITVTVRYWITTISRQETISTMISNINTTKQQ